MKKKFKVLFMAALVCCLSLFIGVVPVMAGSGGTKEEIDEVEKDPNALGRIEGVRCVDGVKKDKESDAMMYRRIHNTPGEVYTRDIYNYEHMDSQYSFLKEYIDMANSMEWGDYTTLEDEDKEGGTVVTITARQGAKVSYFKKKEEIETTPDIYGIDIDRKLGISSDSKTKTRDTYYFHVPYDTIGGRKGGELLVRVKDGTEVQDLKVTFSKPEKKKVKWSGRIKGKLVYPEDSEYGRIELTINGSKVRFATGETFKEFNNFDSYEVTRKDVRDGIRLKFSTKDIQIGTGTAIRNYYEVRSDSDNSTISHYQIGNTVKDDSACYCLGDYTSPTGKSKWLEHFVSVASYSDTEWVINSTIWDISLKMKTIKVRVPAQKKAPNTKVNALRGKINISDKQEYKIKLNGVAVQGDTDRDGFPKEWTPGKKGMLLSDLGDISSGATIKVRIKGTDKKLCSQVRVITIPARQPIDISPIIVEGAVTKCSIKISDLNSKNNPYEYTTETPTETTKWRSITTTTKRLSSKAINAADPVIYIRKKAINEDTRRKLNLRVSSEIAKFTYDSAAGKWTGEAWSSNQTSNQ